MDWKLIHTVYLEDFKCKPDILHCKWFRVEPVFPVFNNNKIDFF